MLEGNSITIYNVQTLHLDDTDIIFDKLNNKNF